MTGYPTVRVGVPDIQSADAAALAQAGAQIVEFSWEKEETYASALEGAKSAFCAMPHHENWKQQFTSFWKATKAAGVKHFVMLSFYHTLASGDDTMTNFASAHEVEDPFIKIPLNWTTPFSLPVTSRPTRSCVRAIRFARNISSTEPLPARVSTTGQPERRC